MSLLKESEHIGLWGIGGDVYRLFSEHVELVELVGNGRIVLFDHSHQGLLWQGSLIKDSAELTDFQYPVVLGPFYVPTLSSMQTVARKLGVEKSITSCFI